MARGKLRIYLGAAPGVGKTFAMLNEGNRRMHRGTDVVVGYVETHGRPSTEEQIGDLEVVPRCRIAYRDTSFDEMDVDAILARAPKVALVDELAHSNIPGSRNEKRWQDVEEILDAGIDVISTVNIQHLESMNDVVEQITGIEQQEKIPDEVVRRAEQIELVDQTPEALRRRMAHGNIYKPEKVDAALANYFRIGNLNALRELALMWTADRVDEALELYREAHGITGTWETRERVVVAITGAPGGDDVIRRAARMAMRTRADLLGVHVRPADGLAGPSTDRLTELRRLLGELGGEYHEVSGSDVADALVGFARAENATQLVMGASQQSRWNELFRGSVVNGVLRSSGPIDVHVISTRVAGRASSVCRCGGRGRRRGLSRRRWWTAWALAALGPPLLALILAAGREGLALSSDLLLFLALVVVVATIGGLLPAVLAAVSGSLLANYYFTPPIHTFTIEQGENLLALVVFLAVAGVVSWLVSVASRRTADAARGACRSGDAGRARRNPRERRGPAAATRRPAPGRVLRRRGGGASGRWWRRLGRSRPRRASRSPRSRMTGPRRCRSARRSNSSWWRPAPVGRGSRRAPRLRRPGRRRGRATSAAGRRRGRGRAGRGERAADGAARGGVPRPAYAARVHQGVGDEPAAARRRLESRRHAGVPRDHRRGEQPAQRARRQPARHESPPDRRGAAGRCATSGSRRWCRVRWPGCPIARCPWCSTCPRRCHA